MQPSSQARGYGRDRTMRIRNKFQRVKISGSAAGAYGVRRSLRFLLASFLFFSFNVSKHRRIAAAGTEVDTGNIQLKLIEVGALMRDFED
jgi:hypothetical protein